MRPERPIALLNSTFEKIREVCNTNLISYSAFEVTAICDDINDLEFVCRLSSYGGLEVRVLGTQLAAPGGVFVCSLRSPGYIDLLAEKRFIWSDRYSDEQIAAGLISLNRILETILDGAYTLQNRLREIWMREDGPIITLKHTFENIQIVSDRCLMLLESFAIKLMLDDVTDLEFVCELSRYSGLSIRVLGEHIKTADGVFVCSLRTPASFDKLMQQRSAWTDTYSDEWVVAGLIALNNALTETLDKAYALQVHLNSTF